MAAVYLLVERRRDHEGPEPRGWLLPSRCDHLGWHDASRVCRLPGVERCVHVGLGVIWRDTHRQLLHWAVQAVGDVPWKDQGVQSLEHREDGGRDEIRGFHEQVKQWA